VAHKAIDDLLAPFAAEVERVVVSAIAGMAGGALFDVRAGVDTEVIDEVRFSGRFASRAKAVQWERSSRRARWHRRTRQTGKTMKCEELLAALNQYVDGEMDPGICEPFQEHLKGCNPCQIIVDNIRQTIQLYRNEQRFELPPTLHQRLGRLLREQWKGKSDEDRPLVRQAAAGDFAAMESLLVKYERQVYAVALRIVQQHQDAEEVAQQTFLSVIEHLDEFREESQFRTWLLRIATNHALALLRKRAVRAAVSIDERDSGDGYEGIPHPEYIAAWRETPEAIALRRETRQYVDEALATLHEKYRVVFVLRDIEELSTRETAEILAISQEAVKVRLLRARLMLRERLTRRFGDDTTRVEPHDHQGAAKQPPS
jgi:RNA polymerase sigma-70 factor (ECF subfamily)